MAYNKLSNYATTISQIDELAVVTYHATQIVKWNNDIIQLNHAGYETVTTKKKMNQASHQFNLGYSVYQISHKWYVDYKGATHIFNGYGILTLDRNFNSLVEAA